MHLHKETIGGLTAGVAGTALGYPLDLVKTRMQTATACSGRNCSLQAVLRGIVRREGLSALYKGLMPPLVSSCTLNAINFTAYSSLHNFYHAKNGWDVRNGLAGATSAPFAATISTVDNFIKTQMQLDNVSQRQYRNSVQCLKSLLRSNGAKVFYTGFGVNALRETLYLGTYFCCYEGMRELLIERSFSVKTAVPIAGGIAGSIGWLVSFPFDCIRARVQGQIAISGNSTVQRKTALEIAASLLKERGLAGLYSGVTPSIIRAFLVSGVRFSAFEFAMYLLTGKRHHES